MFGLTPWRNAPESSFSPSPKCFVLTVPVLFLFASHHIKTELQFILEVSRCPRRPKRCECRSRSAAAVNSAMSPHAVHVRQITCAAKFQIVGHAVQQSAFHVTLRRYKILLQFLNRYFRTVITQSPGTLVRLQYLVVHHADGTPGDQIR